MESQQHALWIRLVLGALALLILLSTLPVYLNPTNNPGLASLTGEAASLGSVAGLFLGRQLTLALIAAYGALRGTTESLFIGAFAIAGFNLHDAVMISAFAGVKPGAIIGFVIALVALGVMWIVHRRSTQLSQAS